MNMNESVHPISDANSAPERTPSARETAFAWVAVAIGYLFCRLFPISASPFGALLIIAAFYIAGGIFLRLTGAVQNRRSVFCLVTSIVFSLSLIVASDGLVHSLSVLWALGCFMMWVMLSYGGGLEKRAGGLLFYDVIKAMFAMPFASFAEFFRSLVPHRGKEGGGRIARQAGFALLGLLAAVIPTAIVILLLSYDEAFSKNIVLFVSGEMPERAVALLFAIPVAAYGYGAFISGIDKKHETRMRACDCRSFARTARFAPETMSCFAMLPLILVYAVFFASQWTYYVSAFSGRLPDGVDIYSQYARDGFGELCTVSGINAAVMIVVFAFTKRRDPDRHSPATRIFVGLLSVSTIILVATAISKMVLYIRVYGLTHRRVYASWFMLLLAAGFLIVLIKQIFPRVNAVCALLAVFVLFFGVLALSDTNGRIAQYNVDRYINGTLAMPGIGELQTLSNECGDSAIPEIARLSLAVRDRPECSDTQKAADTVLADWLDADTPDLLEMTLPRLRARRAAKNAMDKS